MVNDLGLVNSLNKLWDMPVYLYGAGEYGKKVISIFSDFEINVEGVVDRNQKLNGKKLNGIEIFSLEECLNIAARKEIIVIVSTITYSSQIVETLENNNICCNDIYTLFGLFWAFYFNIGRIPTKKQVKEKYCQSFSTWIFSQKYVVRSEQTKIASNSLLSLLKAKGEDIPIIIMQPGKVGSNTVEATLKAHNVFALRFHGILYPFVYENTVFPRYFYDKLKHFRKVKIITLVREPISKDIGHFFQKIDISGNDVGWLVKGIMEKDFQQSFLNYLSLVTPFDFSEGKKNRYDETIISHIDYIGKINENGALWGWFEEEFKKNLGIDILKYEFDAEKGYSIIQKDNIEVLVIKLEYLNKLELVLAEFVGQPGLRMKNANEASSKSYRYAYRQFQKEVKLPRKYVDFYYKSAYIKHFYSRSELANFYAKWENHIIDI